MFNKAPASGSQVVFQPVGGVTPDKPAATGTVAEDGTYSLSTHPYGDGAPEGDYIVIITKYAEDARQQTNAQSQLPGKYADPSQTPLKATVKAGDNQIPTFELAK